MSLSDFAARVAMIVISKEMKKRSDRSPSYVAPKPEKEPTLADTMGGCGCLLGIVFGVIGLFSGGGILGFFIALFLTTFFMYGVGFLIYNIKKEITLAIKKMSQKSRRKR